MVLGVESGLNMVFLHLILAGGVLAGGVVFAEEGVRVGVCELAREAGRFEGKLVEVTGFVSRGFEEFVLWAPECGEEGQIWLEYGGRVGAGTVYCCGVEARRKRARDLEVAGVRIPLERDAAFREFDRLTRRKPERVVRATLVGRIFAKREGVGGYGHFGLYDLLVIQRVKGVEAERGTGASRSGP